MQSSNALKLASAVVLAGSSQAYGQYINLPLPGTVAGSNPGDPETFEYYTISTGMTSSDPTGSDFRFELYNGTGGYFFTEVIPQKATDAVAINYPGGFYASAVANGASLGSDTYTFQSGAQGNSSSIGLVQSYGTPPDPSFQQANTHEFLGFQFSDATGVHNGFFELESSPYVSPGNLGGLTFFRAVYNSVPDGVVGGDIVVPEPGTLSALMLGAAALGAVGLVRRRRSIAA